MFTPQSAREKYNSMNGSATDSEKLDLEKLLELSTAIEREIQSLRGKEVTLVIGKTGSGKSTLINYLMKNKLIKASDDTGEFLIQLERMTIGEEETVGTACRNEKLAEIGHEFVSETCYPKGFETETGLLLCDTAGFGDNRSLENNAAAYLAVQMIIQSVALVKGMIVVVSADDFKGRATGLNETLSLLKRLIMPNKNCMNNYRNSVVFVFTHAEDNSIVKTEGRFKNGSTEHSSWAFSRFFSLPFFLRGSIFSFVPMTSTDINPPLVKTEEQIKNLIKRAQRGLKTQICCYPNNKDIVDSFALCNIMLSNEVQIVIFDPLIEERGVKFRDKPVGRDHILNFMERSGGIAKEDIAFRVERIFQRYSDTFCQIANSFLISHMVIMDESSCIHEYEQKCENAERDIFKLMKVNADLEQYGQKNMHLENLKSKLDKTNDKIDHLKNEADSNNERRRNICSEKFDLENDTTHTLVYIGDVYSENEVYGVVNKGVIKYYNFDHSEDYPIARVDCTGGCYESTEGTFQKFSTPVYNVDRTSCKIKYEGPSHEYGHAEFKVYCEKRYTPDTRAQIKRYENELEAIEKKLDDFEPQLNKDIEMKNYLSELISECKAQNLTDTKQLMDSNKKIIEAHNKELKNFSKILKESIQNLELAKNTLIEKGSQYQMLIQFNKIVPFEEQTIQEFICKYNEYKSENQF